MDLLNVPTSEDDYGGITGQSTNEEKMDAVFTVLKNNPAFIYINYKKLFIERSKEELWDAMIYDTGLVTGSQSGNQYNPCFRLNYKGLLELEKHGSYSNYKNAIKLKELESADHAKKINDLQIRLSESQLRVNELSLIKKPTWKERNWLLIAACAWGIGIVTD